MTQPYSAVGFVATPVLTGKILREGCNDAGALIPETPNADRNRIFEALPEAGVRFEKTHQLMALNHVAMP